MITNRGSTILTNRFFLNSKAVICITLLAPVCPLKTKSCAKFLSSFIKYTASLSLNSAGLDKSIIVAFSIYLNTLSTL